MTGGKASSDSIIKVERCVLILLSHEGSKRQTVVTRSVVRLLAVGASSGGILAAGESPAQEKAGQASGVGTIEMTKG